MVFSSLEFQQPWQRGSDLDRDSDESDREREWSVVTALPLAAMLTQYCGSIGNTRMIGIANAKKWMLPIARKSVTDVNESKSENFVRPVSVRGKPSTSKINTSKANT